MGVTYYSHTQSNLAQKVWRHKISIALVILLNASNAEFNSILGKMGISKICRCIKPSKH